jgi:hypothetical protein
MAPPDHTGHGDAKRRTARPPLPDVRSLLVFEIMTSALSS